MGNCCIQVKLARNRMTIRKRRRIVLLLAGLDNSGKTATAKGLLRENAQGTVPTVGFSSYILTYKGYSVLIYDVGGGPQIRDIWSQYYADVHGIIYVIDASDPSRISESSSVLQKLLIHDKLKGKPLLLLANKQDVEGALDEIDVVERLNLEAIVNELKCPTLVETCCAVPPASGSKLHKRYIDPGIENGFRWLLSVIIKDFHAINKRVEEDTEKAQAELMLEKENRRKRVEEQRRQREEIEGTIIIPLRDGSPDSNKSGIIIVQSSEVTERPLASDKTLHSSESQDSGCTVQNGHMDRDVDSLSTVKSRDSAVQSMHNTKVEDCKLPIANDNYDPKSRVFKNKVFMKRSNKTAPAEVLASPESRPTARHRLPPLTPPPNHIKMFEAKSAKRARFVKSMSLSFDKSESDLTDEEKSLNLVSFPSDWKLLRHPEGKESQEEPLNEAVQRDDENRFGRTFIVSHTIKEND